MISTPRWRAGSPAAVDRLVGQQELVAPDGIRKYFSELFAAFPDFKLEVIDEVAGGDKTAVRWRASGTFAGPGAFQGFDPNGARIDDRGLRRRDRSSEDELIVHNDAYIDTGDIARQLGVLPAAGSHAETPADAARQPAHAGPQLGPRGRRPSRSPTACGSCAAASRPRR